MSVGCSISTSTFSLKRTFPPRSISKCSHAAGHSGEHRLGVNWPLGEKQKLKVSRMLRPMDFFTLFGERYQVRSEASWDDRLGTPHHSLGWL